MKISFGWAHFSIFLKGQNKKIRDGRGSGRGGIILLSMISLDHDRVVEIVMLYHVALLREKKTRQTRVFSPAKEESM
jgi:hypothetical protein